MLIQRTIGAVCLISISSIPNTRGGTGRKSPGAIAIGLEAKGKG
jgi:hypothetical protein